jgi:hypothetical protein
MNNQEREEIEVGRQEFLKALPYIIGISVVTALIISSVAKHYH